MAASTLRAESSVLVVVDIQPSFFSGIVDGERILERTEFLLRVARTMDVPVLTTEQYPSRMGGTHERLLPLLGNGTAMAKMSFSCSGCEAFQTQVNALNRKQVVLVGIETHICVSQTAHDLLRSGYEVIIGADAISARTLDRHKIGLKRIRDAGAVTAHTESIAYEWMESADHPKFRDILKIVKEYT